MITIRHSVWLTLLIAGAAAVIAIPSPEEPPYTTADPLRVRLAYVSQRFSIQSELYRREHSRMLARNAVQARSAGAAPLRIVRPPDVPVGLEQRINISALKGVASLPRHDANMRVVYVLTLDTGTSVAGARVQKRDFQEWSVDIFPPGAVAPNTCVEVVRAHNARALEPPKQYDFREPSWSEPLGDCWWYAAYGTPGRGVATWLDSTHYAPIQRRAQFDMDYWDWVNAPRQIGGWLPDQETEGAMTSCAAGRTEQCLRLAWSNIALPSDEWVMTPNWIGQGRDWNLRANDRAGALLRRLQSALGPDEFEKFWKSDEPVAAAFHTVHGGSYADWVRDVTRQFVPESRERSLPSWTTLVSALVCAIGLLLLGTRAVARRSGFA